MYVDVLLAGGSNGKGPSVRDVKCAPLGTKELIKQALPWTVTNFSLFIVLK
jgi:hypothetical protein